MRDLIYGTGKETFSLNGDENCTISFMPSDYNFVRDLEQTFEKLEATQNKYSALYKNVNGDVHKAIEIINSADKEIRATIDSLFDGDNVSEKAFGKQSVYALSEGAPLWTNFLMAIFEMCDKEFTAQETAKNPRFDRLVKKYGHKK